MGSGRFRAGAALLLRLQLCCASAGCGGRAGLDAQNDVPVCVPGRRLDCVCADLSEGSQTCRDDYTFGDCVCSRRGGDPGSGGGGRPATSASSGEAGTTGPSSGGTGGTPGSGGQAGAGGADVLRSISLEGKVTRVVYDPSRHTVYGLDPANRRIAVVELATETSTYADVVQVPNDACVSHERERLFVVNSGSTLISEYALNDLGHVRDLQWGASVHAFSDTHFHIRCGVDRLYVVDGQWAPGLWTVENLDGSPTAVDHTEQVSGVGDFVLSADETELYYWYQYGWGAGLAGTAVYRVETGTWSLLDETLIDYQDAFYRDPLDTPILLDESSSLLLAKNRVFDAFNLTKVLFTFTSDGDDVFDGAVQNAYAADFAATVMASKTQVFSLTDYAAVEPVAASGADQLFFDKNGRLYALVVNRGALVYQDIAAP